MKANKLMITFIALGLALVGCGKKESDFKARYARNGSGAYAVDASRNESAINLAQRFGLTNLDVINIRKQGGSGSVAVDATLVVNSTALDIRTNHSGTNEVKSNQPSNIGGFNVYVNTMCSNQNCDIYFIMLTAYQGNTQVMQAGVMKSFLNTSQDKYQWIESGRFVPFYGSSWYDSSTMIGLLLSGTQNYNNQYNQW